jgi:hypothetical protein
LPLILRRVESEDSAEHCHDGGGSD